MPSIKYQFIADGVATVRDGFKSIGDAARDANKAVAEGARVLRTSSRESGRALTAQEKFAKDLAAAAKKAEIADRKRAAEEAKQMRAAEREQERAAKHVAGIKDRHFREQQKQGERAEAVRRREIAKEISDRRSHEDRLKSIKERANEKNRENERRHAERMATFKRETAERTKAATLRDFEREQSAVRNKQFDRQLQQKRFNTEFAKRKKDIDEKRSDGFKASVRGGFIGASAGVVASTLGIAGSAARQSLALHEVSNRLSIASRGAGEEAVDPRELRKEFEATAARTPGIAAIDIANAVSQFVSKTGELGVARKSQGVFATVASATGSSIEDVSAAAADLFQKFDITSMDDMADAMAALAFQGKAGSFELKDAASQFAKLSAAASRFGLAKGSEGVRTLGGLTQIARSATGSPEQAATAIEAMFRQFTSTPALKQLKAIRVDPFKDKGHTQTKEIRGLLVETISKAGGDLAKLQGIFGEEGIRAISPIISEFNKAKQAASVGGASAKDSNEAGSKAAKSYIDKMIDAPGDYKELQRDAAQAQQDASAKLSNAWEKIVGELSDGAIPALTSLVTTLENSPGAIEALVGTIDNLVYFFTALVEASQAVLEFFKIVSKKTVSPEEKQAEARKKAEIAKANLDRFDKKRGGSLDQVADLQIEAGKLRKEGKIKEAVAKEKEADAMYKRIKATPEQDAERLKLVGELEHAKANVGRATAEVSKVSDQQNRIRSADSFAKEYEAMLNASNPSDPGKNKTLAQTVAHEMNDSRWVKDMANTETLSGESEEARDFRVRQATARRDSMQIDMYGKEKTSGSADASMARVEAAAKALEQAATTIKGMGQASIVPQP